MSTILKPINIERFAADVVLRDGSLAHVRPVRPEDRPLLVDFLKNLSPETLYQRFINAAIRPETDAGRMMPGPERFALLAMREGRVVGHVVCQVTSPGKAEVGVVVADAYQGKGLGTILLGQLAEAANAAGIAVLEATVSPGNLQMIRVLRHLGFPTPLNSGPGIIHVTFPTSLSPEALEAFERREAMAAAAAMLNFFRPRGVAVIGASRERGSIGAELFRNIIEAGFQGPVYPVNSEADVVQSVIAYHTVLDCPGPVDLAFIVVPAQAALPVARDCARKGVRALVVISAGFAEANEEGTRLQQELVGVCREAGMRLIGPNCMGIINTDPQVSLNGQFSIFKPIPGRIGFLSQSGALGIAIIDHATKLGLGMSTFVSVGNKADISGNDLVQYWENDDSTGLILLYLESFGNPRKFARIARHVGRKKPIVVVKSGRSTAGFRATQSHTGALIAASDFTVDALFRQSGVIRVDTLSQMFDIAALLITQPSPKGDRVAIITNAGGGGILAADTCEACGLQVPELSPETQAALHNFLPPAAGVKNPVDMIASATADDYARAICAVASDPGIDALIVIFVPPIAVRSDDVAAEILKAARELTGRMPILTTFMAHHGLPEVLSDGHISVPSYPFPEVAASTLARVVQYGKWLATPEGKVPHFAAQREEAVAIVAQALNEGGRWLSPEDTGALLDCYSIPLVKTVQVITPEEAGRAAAELRGKVALKAIATGLVHKTEAGAVKLNLVGKGEVEKAAQEMQQRMAAAGFAPDGFLLQPMVPKGVEMLVGVTHDPVFGPVVACGAGGVLVELLKDVAVRITPLTDRDASEMVRSLKTFPLLTGYRGGLRYDVTGLEDVLLKVGALVEDVPEVVELDLNPVMVLPEGQGVFVVDARIRVAETALPLPLGARRR